MKRRLLLLILGLSLLSSAQAQELEPTMRAAFSAFQKLQYYLVDSKTFSDPKNSDEIKKTLSDLSSTFHTVEQAPRRYKNDPFFVANVSMLRGMLDDSMLAVKENHSSYGYWRLRGLSTHCISCHALFNANLPFNADNTPLPRTLAPSKRATFFVATRQYAQAKKELLAAIYDEKNSLEHLTALRQYLLVALRTDPNSEKVADELSKIETTAHLIPADREHVLVWIKSLRSHKALDLGSLANIEKVIQNTVQEPINVSTPTDEVTLLRATAALHLLLNNQPKDRSKILYLLGAAYSKVPSFFTNELPTVYLEQCIRDYPNTSQAKRSYELYEQQVVAEFTGSSGTHLPADVKAGLRELKDLANGVPRVPSSS
jgi:hypothetical protein